jgi:hypothetical protein
MVSLFCRSVWQLPHQVALLHCRGGLLKFLDRCYTGGDAKKGLA